MAAIDVIYAIYSGFYFFMFWFWWAIILVGIFIMKFLYKNWKVEAVIIEKRGDNLIKSNDRAMRFIDPYTGVTGYRLQKAKDTIPVYNFDWVMHNAAVPTTFIEKLINLLRGNVGTIFLFRYGSKQYKPVKIKQGDKIKTVYKSVKSEKGEDVYVKIYKPFDPRDILGELDFEVVDWDNMNFMVQEQRASMERRKKKGDFWKQVVIPIMLLAITALVCIVMLKFSFDYAAQVRGSAPPQAPPKVPIIGDFVPGS